MPGRKWYAIALLVVVAGTALAGVVAYTRLNGLAGELAQVVVPGETNLTLSQAGTYTVYLERESVVDGVVYTTSGDVQGLRVRVSSSSGTPIEIGNPSMTSNYSIAGRAGSAVLSFTVSEPGQYHFAARYSDGRTEPQAVLAVGLGVAEKILTTILQAMGIGFLGFVTGVIVAVITFMKRRKASRGAVAVPSGAVAS